MANKKFLLGILVMTLVFGMTVVGCDSANQEPDPLELIKGTYASYFIISDSNYSYPFGNFGAFRAVVFDGSQRFTELAGVWDIEDNTQIITETSYQNFTYDGNILRIIGTTAEYMFSKDKNIFYYIAELDYRRIEQKETMQAQDVSYHRDPYHWIYYLAGKTFTRYFTLYEIDTLQFDSSELKYTFTRSSGDPNTFPMQEITGVISFPNNADHGTSFLIPALSNNFIPCYFSSDGKRLYVHVANSVTIFYNNNYF